MILLIILGIIVVLGIVIAVRASKNVKEMDKCVEETLGLISKGHKVTELPTGEYAEMKAKGIMKFKVKQFDVENVGNLSVMTVNAGFMQMASFVFTPLDKDIALLSCDYMYILSNRKAYLEVYDLVSEKTQKYETTLENFGRVFDAYPELGNIEPSKAWYEYLLTQKAYKAGKPADDDTLRELLLKTVGAYYEQADAFSVLDDAAKAEKAAVVKQYSDRLIDEGGISTDFFKSTFGADVTRDFFDKVFFGTQR